MMKKGYLATLLTAAAVLVSVSQSHALAPVIANPGDVIIGDNEGVPDNNFNFPDAFDLYAITTDDNGTTAGQLKYSYDTTSANVRINGIAPLGGGNPINPPAGNRLDQNDTDTGNPGQDAFANTLTLRNVTLSPSNAGPFTDPGVNGIVTSQTATVTLWASDCTTAGMATILVYTANSTSDSISGGSALTDIIDLDFENNPGAFSGWLGGTNLNGIGSPGQVVSTQVGAMKGLCMTTPLTGNNELGWVFVGGFSGGLIQLIDLNVWRMRCKFSSDRSVAGTTPLIDMSYDNTVANPGVGNVLNGGTFGGEHIILDNEGGANAVATAGITQGRNIFDFWVAPAPMLTPQFRGIVDSANSAYDNSVDDSNDLNPKLRLLDFDAAGIQANLDSGTVCLNRLTLATAPLTALRVGENLAFGPPITTSAFAPQSTAEQSNGGTATITGGEARYQLTTNNFKTLLPFENTGGVPVGNDFNLALYPIQWQLDELFLISSDMRSNVPGPAEGTTPLDVIQVTAFEPTVEVLHANVTIAQGAAGNMQNAGAPRLEATVSNAPQTYVALYFTHNKTLSLIVNGDRWQPSMKFLNNNPAIAGAGTDAFAVKNLKVFKLPTP